MAVCDVASVQSAHIRDEQLIVGTRQIKLEAESMEAEQWPSEREGPEDSRGGDTGLEHALFQISLQPSQSAEGSRQSYPERQGEVDCSYYMRTGQCAFGMQCRYNHPSNRHLGGAAIQLDQEDLPERPGQPDCQYFLKTGTCKFGTVCKYNHPKDMAATGVGIMNSFSALPVRPGERECTYYMRTGTCKYGITCKYNHPKLPISSSIVNTGALSLKSISTSPQGIGAFQVPRPAFLSQRLLGLGGYPSLVIPHMQGIMPVPSWGFQNTMGQLSSDDGSHQFFPAPGYIFGHPGGDSSGMANYPNYTPGSVGDQGIQEDAAQRGNVFPSRPGQPECQYYIKTGECKFGPSCRYHHPKNRILPSPSCLLSTIGLPLRPGMQVCTFYSKYGMCKFGQTCRFDHPEMGIPGYSISISSGSLVGPNFPSLNVMTSPETAALQYVMTSSRADQSGASNVQESGESGTGIESTKLKIDDAQQASADSNA